ncbi:MAG TPA: NAD(P)/FAD-dependent oxidoreductase [Abditibacterium sp.]|jgi:thioredoxin reductase (NADPH)
MAQESSEIYDCAIIGGGPAGLAAAVGLGRALRKTALFDAGEGRTVWNQLNENYLGFPNGIRARELVRRGRAQAERFGAELRAEKVQSVTRQGQLFCLDLPGDDGSSSSLRARSLIMATGVTDVWPDFPGARRYVGKSLFWCITCDGFRCRDARVVVLGNVDEAATTALQLLNYTSRVSFLCSEAQSLISPQKRRQMQRRGIPFFSGRLVKAKGAKGQLQALWTESGECIELDFLFSMLGQVPNSQLAAGLGATLVERGCIKVDSEQKTNVPGVFAAGDVTNLPAQQVATAVHQGTLAAASANYYLYSDTQKTLELAAKPAA